jgi:transcriptional regulator with XRE-family HTH domain
VVLRALREAAGATQAGWAARLGVGRTTVQRWETGELPPGPDAEASLLRACADRGLLRTYYQGPLRGVTVGPDLIRDLLAEARLRTARPRAQRRAARSERPGTGNLPTPRTSFIGRARDLVEVQAMLQSPGPSPWSGPAAPARRGWRSRSRIALRARRPRACGWSTCRL